MNLDVTDSARLMNVKALSVSISPGPGFQKHAPVPDFYVVLEIQTLVLKLGNHFAEFFPVPQSHPLNSFGLTKCS